MSAASASPFATAGPSAFGGKSSFGGFGGGFGGVPGGLGNGFGGVPGSLGSTGFGGALGAPLKSFASPAPAFGAAAKTFGAAADEDDEEGEVADEEDAEKGLGAEDERVKDSRFYEQDGKLTALVSCDKTIRGLTTYSRNWGGARNDRIPKQSQVIRYC